MADFPADWPDIKTVFPDLSDEDAEKMRQLETKAGFDRALYYRERTLRQIVRSWWFRWWRITLFKILKGDLKAAKERFRECEETFPWVEKYDPWRKDYRGYFSALKKFLEEDIDPFVKLFKRSAWRSCLTVAVLAPAAACGWKLREGDFTDLAIVLWGGGVLVWLGVAFFVLRWIGGKSFVKGMARALLSMGLIIGYGAAVLVPCVLTTEEVTWPQFLIVLTVAALGYLSYRALRWMEAKYD